MRRRTVTPPPERRVKKRRASCAAILPVAAVLVLVLASAASCAATVAPAAAPSSGSYTPDPTLLATLLATPPPTEGSCAGVCGNCWYGDPADAATLLCCCTADCTAFGDCCADLGPACAGPRAPASPPTAAQPAAAQSDVPATAIMAPPAMPLPPAFAPPPFASEDEPTVLAGIPDDASVAEASPAPQQQEPPLPLLGEAPLPLAEPAPAPTRARCGGVCGGCLYGDAQDVATKLCCCLPDCVSFGDWCVRRLWPAPRLPSSLTRSRFLCRTRVAALTSGRAAQARRRRHRT